MFTVIFGAIDERYEPVSSNQNAGDIYIYDLEETFLTKLQIGLAFFQSRFMFYANCCLFCMFLLQINLTKSSRRMSTRHKNLSGGKAGQLKFSLIFLSH